MTFDVSSGQCIWNHSYWIVINRSLWEQRLSAVNCWCEKRPINLRLDQAGNCICSFRKQDFSSKPLQEIIYSDFRSPKVTVRHILWAKIWQSAGVTQQVKQHVWRTWIWELLGRDPPSFGLFITTLEDEITQSIVHFFWISIWGDSSQISPIYKWHITAWKVEVCHLFYAIQQIIYFPWKKIWFVIYIVKQMIYNEFLLESGTRACDECAIQVTFVPLSMNYRQSVLGVPCTTNFIGVNPKLKLLCVFLMIRILVWERRGGRKGQMPLLILAKTIIIL